MRIPLSGLLICLLASQLGTASDPDRRDRKLNSTNGGTFIAAETQHLLGSPNPLPLEVERAFPKLLFEEPVELTFAPDDRQRLFVLERKGVIRTFENRDNVSKHENFLDLRNITLSEGNEEGLLGLAFHPKFRENGEFFVYYSSKPRSTTVSRFRVSQENPKVADRQSEEKLLQIPQPFENHKGGSIRFGADGCLYIGLGDGGASADPHGNGQNLGVLLGKILRIDVDQQEQGRKYSIPKDNPFVNQAGARGEIWAYGFRNVWRMAFDRKTGDLWAGDVGQDRFEEINLVRRGGNYGWNQREGFHPFEPATPTKTVELIDPLVEYFRGEGQSVTGGMVYRGSRMPQYNGAYFYGDHISGNVWMIRWNGQRVTEQRPVATTSLHIAAFGEDANGEMYIVDLDGGLYRLRPRKEDLQAVAKRFPRKLSETGLFMSVKDNEPAPSLIPYEVNVPFWSDFTVKDRYLALPDGGRVRFDEQEKWQFPVGTVFVKTLWMHRDRVNYRDRVRIETRLLVNTPAGWTGYTYAYHEDQNDAVLVENGKFTSLNITTGKGLIRQSYHIPGMADCMTCHTKAEGFVLGLTTRQMNRIQNYRGHSRNQLDALQQLGIFENKPLKPANEQEAFPDWGFGNLNREQTPRSIPAAKESLDAPKPQKGEAAKLARAWLEVNCAMCHRPASIGPSDRDLRFHTPLEKMKLVGETPRQGHLSPGGSFLITAGNPDRSELLFRAAHRGERQMPPLATKVVDERAIQVLRTWIAEIEPLKKPKPQEPEKP